MNSIQPTVQPSFITNHTDPLQWIFDSTAPFSLFPEFHHHPARGEFNILDNKKENQIIAEIPVPGYNKESISLTLDDDRLTVTTFQQNESQYGDDDGITYYYRGLDMNETSKTYKLPAPVSTEGVQAKLEKGMLTVVMKKSLDHQPKQISIA